MAASTPVVVDIHTHMYPPSYIAMLEKRQTIPLVRTFPQADEPRLILLSSELAALDAALADPAAKLPGRPLSTHFASLAQKMHFMDTNGIRVSVISLANPWFDFLAPDEAPGIADAVNAEFSDMCAQHVGRLFFFAALPLSAPVDAVKASIERVKNLKYCRGIILGTSGLGKGLDDPHLLPVFEAVADAKLLVFLAPHYGLPNEVYGPRSEEYGHVLPLALGFPMETTIAVARMYMAGVFDHVRNLQMLLAHSGGTLPFLAGRIESCIVHDGHLVKTGKVPKDRRTIWTVLKEQIYLDAVIYSEVGLQAAIASSGADRLMFGTDHPFFPPIEEDVQGPWDSSRLNAQAVIKAVGEGSSDAAAVMGLNAVRVLSLKAE
uniref:Uracil-5-carboxylate decarboxylase n=1 Tax=Cordyceps militaris (strain CM01) TaxID=983644 RepID=UPI0003AFF96E|nr:Chain A, Uracil-5-carboxylate decarboxylase [Cordyceps militaris CM01]4LAN_B Chain B, Uracil-5-carboxylate decarboxylase [Cordyceps militaris CM01]4LAO_A Chain A, Cordyceps militaris IDCase [Cordyceps militaris CM01]4LAO_B Chain B, Cordyceps militaris IDCase [Cordyceps militaris CM01]